MTVTHPQSPTPDARLRAAFAQRLDADAIARGAGGGVLVRTALHTGSTNADLLAGARKDASSQAIVLAAVAQTAGRGRHGRRWMTAPGSALLFSVAMPLPPEAPADAAVTLACGVGLVEALIAQQVPAALKWPNDLLLGQAKLGGVLAELATDAGGGRTLVLGVGVNLWVEPSVRDSVGRPIAALSDHLELRSLADRRERWIGRLVRAVIDSADEFHQRGFVPFQPRFMRHFGWLGREIEVFEQGACVAAGRALGVDGGGRLLVEVGGRVTPFNSGDVSLRVRGAGVAQRALREVT